MQTLRSMTFSDLRQPLSEFLIGNGARKKRLPQGAQIKAGATDKDREVTASFDFGNCLDCRTRPIGRGESHLRRNKVDEMMWNAATLIERDFRSRNFNLLINLDGIAVDDLAAEAQSYFNSQSALARCRGTDDGDDVTQIVNLRWRGLGHELYLNSYSIRSLPAHSARCSRGDPALLPVLTRKLTVCVTAR